MSEKNDGGSAFSVTHVNNPRGMSLRDYFAAAAMHGIVSSASEKTKETWSKASRLCGTTVEGFIAATAYDHADAMLSERDK